VRVLLIYPNITDYPIDISYGLAAISSALKNSDHTVKLMDCTFSYDKDNIELLINDFSPHIVGIPVASNDFHFAVEICKSIKALTDVTIVAGGYHTTMAPEDIMEENCFDIAVIGEGEESLIAIVEAKMSGEFIKKLYEIDGIWFRNNGEVVKNSLRPLNNDINKLSFPDKSLFDYQRYININRGLATFITSYGCPFKCSYCINKVLMDKFGTTGFVRYKSIDYLIDEIKSVISKFKVREIEFYDDTFTINKERIQQFCKIYPKEIGLPFYINSRVDTLNREVIQNLKEAGCMRISMGIETGDNYVRNEILQRNQSDDQIIETFKMVRNAGMKTLSYSMVGIPYETSMSIEQTIELNRKCRPDFIAISIFNAYKGTGIYDVCKKNGWLNHDKGLAYFQTSNINHPNFSINELKRIRDRFGYDVFKDYNYKRAVIDLIDKKMLTNRWYQKGRSYLIKHGIKKFL
jgi:anaerobic magnesium-protoporphyrin IX monomethyl ester cyclase